MNNLAKQRQNLLFLLQAMDADPELLESVEEMDEKDLISALHKFKSAIHSAQSREEGQADVWYVYYHIHQDTPHKKKPKLFIEGVPKEKEVGWDLVDEYRLFGEFGTKHANHGIGKLTPDSPKEVKRAWRNPTGQGIEIVQYDELKKLRNTV